MQGEHYKGNMRKNVKIMRIKERQGENVEDKENKGKARLSRERQGQ